VADIVRFGSLYDDLSAAIHGRLMYSKNGVTGRNPAKNCL